LTSGKALTKNKTLQDSNGNFKKLSHLMDHFDLDLEEIYCEFTIEIVKLVFMFICRL